MYVTFRQRRAQKTDGEMYYFLIRLGYHIIYDKLITLVMLYKRFLPATGKPAGKLFPLQEIRDLQALFHHIAPDVHRLLDPLHRPGVRLHRHLRSGRLHGIPSQRVRGNMRPGLPVNLSCTHPCLDRYI